MAGSIRKQSKPLPVSHAPARERAHWRNFTETTIDGKADS